MITIFFQGVKPMEIVISNIACELLALTIETGFLFFLLTHILNFKCEGSLPLAVLICLFQGACGLCEGKLYTKIFITA